MGERAGVRTVVPKEILFEIDLVPGTWYLGKKLASADLTSSE
jgi:hypothetical protein